MRTSLRIVKTKWLIVCISVMITIFVFGTDYKKPVDDRRSQSGYIPKDGFVPDKTTAIKIAEAVWVSIYGEQIYKEKPYKINLEHGVWYIEGSLPPNYKGGVAYIEIQKKDGRILKVMHGK